MVITDKPTKQQIREFSRWREILHLVESNFSKSQIAIMQDVGEEQVRRLIKAAKAARQQGWI